MIVRVSGAPRAAWLSGEEFQEHWRGPHGDLAGKIEGVRGYIQNHAVLDHGWPLLPWPGLDACIELEFDSLEAMDRGFASEFYRGAVMADEQSFVDKTRFSMLLAQRRVLTDREPPPDSVKLLTFLPRAANAEGEALVEALTGPYSEALGDAPILRRELLVEMPGAHDGRPAPFCSVVDVLWFPGPGEALEFVRGPLGNRARFALAGLAFGAERLIARPIRIV
jgi:uncharacterized protein (TIGR02118 family)